MTAQPSKGLKRMLRAANRLHAALYRWSGGKFANRIANLPVLLITTYGRITGNPTTNAAVFIQNEHSPPEYLVSATNGDSDRNPGWYQNLKARPEAQIEIGGAVCNVRAMIIEGAKRQRLYEKFKAASPNFVKYEQGASRELPVIRLVPISNGRQATHA